MAILLSSLLSKTMTAIDRIMQTKKVPEYIRKRLVEAEIDNIIDHLSIVQRVPTRESNNHVASIGFYYPSDRGLYANYININT